MKISWGIQKLYYTFCVVFFRNTFSEVQENAAQIWKFQRYGLIIEYAARPVLIPPFILLAHLYIFLKWLWKKMTCTTEKESGSGLSKY